MYMSHGYKMVRCVYVGEGGTPHSFRPQYYILFFIFKTNFVFSAKNESLIKVDKLHFYLMT